MEQLIAEHAGLGAAEEALRAEVRAARQQGIVGLKSIAAYRGGLHVAPRTHAEAAAAYAGLRELVARDGRVPA